jgi:hypothetical protein
VPGNSLIFTSAKGVTAIQLVPPGGFVQDGTVLRMHIQVFGRLLDGTKVKSSSYEYVVEARTGYVISGVCSTGAPFACENGGQQDTAVGCF